MTINVEAGQNFTARSKTGSSYRGDTPNGELDPYSLPLAAQITNGDPIGDSSEARAYFDSVYVGGFRMDNSLGGNYRTTNGRIAYNHASNSIYTTDRALNTTSGDAASATEGIAEVQLPLVGDFTKDPNTFPEATVKIQDWVQILGNNKVPVTNANSTLGGLYYNPDDGSLWCQSYIGYSGGTTQSASVFRITDASDIAGSEVKGSWRTSSPLDQDCVWMSEVPSIWKSVLGGTHLFGTGAGMSNHQRTSSGPSAWATDLDAFDVDAGGVIPQTEIMNYPGVVDGAWYPIGTGTSLYATYPPGHQYESFNNTTNRRNYDEYNNLKNFDANAGVDKWDVNNNDVGVGSGNHYNAAGVTPGNNNVWSEISSAGGGFIIPGTRTYLAFGQMSGGVGGGGYKLAFYDEQDNLLSQAGGGTAAVSGDRLPYYWLYDMAELRDAVDKDTVNPYSYGTLDIFAGISGSPISAMCDPRTGKAFIVCTGGVFASESGANTQVLQLQF